MNKPWLEFARIAVISCVVAFIVYQIAYGTDSDKWLDIIKVLTAWGVVESGGASQVGVDE